MISRKAAPGVYHSPLIFFSPQTLLNSKLSGNAFHSYTLETSDGNQRPYVLEFLKTVPDGVSVIYVYHGSANAYICFTILNGTYGTILELGYDYFAITGAKGVGWGEWRQIS